MNLTVGVLENKLRQFPKGTKVHVNCGCCNHGSSGNETILDIKDNTNQTYGYIEINLNASSKAGIELSADKEEFYRVEIDKLKKLIKNQDDAIKIYKEFIESAESSIRCTNRMLKY